MEIHKCWYDCYQFLSIIDFIDWSGRRECERKWIAIYHVGYYITEITKQLTPLICLFISILNNAIATKKDSNGRFPQVSNTNYLWRDFMHFALKIFLGISFTGIFQIPVSRSNPPTKEPLVLLNSTQANITKLAPIHSSLLQHFSICRESGKYNFFGEPYRIRNLLQTL